MDLSPSPSNLRFRPNPFGNLIDKLALGCPRNDFQEPVQVALPRKI